MRSSWPYGAVPNPYGAPVLPPTFSAATSGSSTSVASWATQFLGLSSLFGLFTNAGFDSSALKLLMLGTIIETGRRFANWAMERFRFKYTTTARFDMGDPAYEWIVLFLTQEGIWKRSKDFAVSAPSSLRKWGIKPTYDGAVNGNAEYVPTYSMAQLFRWKGYWIEIQRTGADSSSKMQSVPGFSTGGSASITLTFYTLRLSAMYELVEEARRRYIETSRPNVTIYTADMPSHGPMFAWTTVKHKARRPLDSIILPDGLLGSILEDAKDFIESEDWYLEAGIPHRRGYLLYGPPGTGKTSTIYTLAGELGLEIYSISLASGFVDDSFLQRAVNSIPKHSIILIEDIDCAFPSREEVEAQEEALLNGTSSSFGMSSMSYPGLIPQAARRSAVTLSGLLNVIDGVGSEEGRLFFATTNYVDRLDPALMRPGRIDRRIEYTLAVKDQAEALFNRFFPPARFPNLVAIGNEKTSVEDYLHGLSAQFSALVPEKEFSTAELQGYLLSCKRSPQTAVDGIADWVKEERADRAAKKAREDLRKQKLKDAKLKMEGMRSFSGYPLIPPPPSFNVKPVAIPTPPHTGSPVLADLSIEKEAEPGPVGTEET